MPEKKDNDITDLIVPEDDLLNFQMPAYGAVRAAYSKSFKAKENPIKRIEQLFPKKQAKKKPSQPVFNIDQDEDPLII